MNETINIVNTLLGLPISKLIFKKYLVDSRYIEYEKDNNNNGQSIAVCYYSLHKKLFQLTGIKPYNNEADEKSDS